MIPRLGVNIDHIATLRELRGTPYPSILAAARLAETGGADQITVHLREDRRHIQDEDVRILRRELKIALNLEMALSPAMIRFAKKTLPDWVCLVPEKRKELTTEGGLNLKKNQARITSGIAQVKKAGIRVSLFIEPDLGAVNLSKKMGSDAIELHTGRFCLATQGAFGKRNSVSQVKIELRRIKDAALLARDLGLKVHAGHGFDYENVRQVVELETAEMGGGASHPLVEEYNIGHSIICRAALVGLERAVREMVSAIQAP